MGKISDYATYSGVPADGDIFPFTDISDTTQAASGSTKKITAADILSARQFFVTVGSSKADHITDGTADNVQILAAMTEAQLTGKQVYIKEGTYDMAAQIVFHNKSNVTVRGAGSGKTILRRSFTGGASMIDIGSGSGPIVSDNITVSDLTIDQNTIGSGWGLVVSWCTNVLIENIKFVNQNTTSLAALLVGKFGGGSDNYEGHTIRVVNCIFDYSNVASLDWEVISCVNGRNVVFDKCTWKGIAEAWPGLTVYNTEQCTITNSFVDHSKLIIGGRGTYSVLNTMFEQSYLFLDQVKNIYVGAGTSFYTWGTTTGFTNGIEFNGGYKTGGDIETPWYITQLSFATTDVNTTTDVITLSSTTSFPTATVVRFTSTGTVPGGLSTGVDYYVINTGATTIKVAASEADALSSTAIDLTSQGTGTHTVTVSTVFNCENVVIDGVIFKGAKPNAIRAKTSTEAGKEVLDCRDLTIANCKIEDCTGIPIIAFAKTLKIINNEIRNGNTDNSVNSAYHLYIAAQEATVTDNYASSANVTLDVAVDHTRFTTLLPTMKLRVYDNQFSSTSLVRYFNSGGTLQTAPTAEVTLPYVENKVSTTNATVTTLSTINIPASTIVIVSGFVYGRRTGGTAGTAEDGAMYRIEAVYQNIAGSAVLIGSSGSIIGESEPGWDITMTASGATGLIRVIGVANNNITWKSKLQVNEVSQ